MSTPLPKFAIRNTADVVSANVRAQAGIRGWNQSDLVKLTGMTQPAINKRWNGRMAWKLEELDLLARVFGMSPAELVTPIETERRRALRAVQETKKAPDLSGSGASWLPRLDSNQQPSD